MERMAEIPVKDSTLVFDLSYATQHYPGVGSYAVGLAKALLEARPDWPWRMLVPRAPDRFDLSFVPQHAQVSAPEPGAFMGQNALGELVRKQRAMLYHSPYLYRPWGAKCPCVLTVHDIIPLGDAGGLKGAKRSAYRWLVNDALKAERVITDSEASRGAIQTEFGREGARAAIRAEKNPDLASAILQMVVVPAGCNLADNGEAWPAWPRPAVLAVGINKPHKNLETLVQAMALLPGESRPLLVHAGPVDARYPDATALAKRYGIPGDVTQLGMVPEDQLAALYRSATLFAFPTRAEGFGLPLLEAFTFGLPALASDLPVLRELSGDAAWLLPPDDAPAWANAITTLLADDLLRQTMAQHGEARANRFSYADAALALIHEYQQLAPALAGMALAAHESSET